MERNKGNKAVHGFVWGVAVGAGLVLFLKSQKGKELVKKLRDEGIDQLNEMAEKMEEEEDLAAPVHPPHEVAQVEHEHTHHDPFTAEHHEPIKILHVHSGQVDTEVDTSEHKEKNHKKSSRKLFKGIGKK